MLFSSCSQEAIYYDASGNSVSEASALNDKNSFVAAESEAPAVSDTSKFVIAEPEAPVVSDPGKFVVAETAAPKKKCWWKCKKKEKKAYKKQKCVKCLSFYCPKPGCCGTVGENVLSRATMQGGSGEPHIGLIPTMKTLAP